MSYEYKRRGKNWHTAMGLLFIVSGMIVLVRQILIWTPDFVFDFLVNSEFTNEKVSIAMLGLVEFWLHMECVVSMNAEIFYHRMNTKLEPRVVLHLYLRYRVSLSFDRAKIYRRSLTPRIPYATKIPPKPNIAMETFSFVNSEFTRKSKTKSGVHISI